MTFTYVTLPLPYLSRQLAGEEEGSDGEDDIHPEVSSSKNETSPPQGQLTPGLIPAHTR